MASIMPFLHDAGPGMVMGQNREMKMHRLTEFDLSEQGQGQTQTSLSHLKVL